MAIERYPKTGNYTCSRPYYAFTTQAFGYRCGKCPGCLNARTLYWINRSKLETAYAEKGMVPFFFTFTYRDLDDFDGTYKNMRTFFNRLKHKIKHRYLVTTEYGTKYGRPHHHAIIWMKFDQFECLKRPKVVNRYFRQKYWRLGHVMVKPILTASHLGRIDYVCKYIFKEHSPIMYSRNIGGVGAEKIMQMLREHHKIQPFKSVYEFPKSIKINIMGKLITIVIDQKIRYKLKNEFKIPNMVGEKTFLIASRIGHENSNVIIDPRLQANRRGKKKKTPK